MNDPQVVRSSERAKKRQKERSEGKRPKSAAKKGRWRDSHLRPVTNDDDDIA